MVIREFGCLAFRNYRQLRAELSPGITVFVGENGQGKTNLVEGLYFLCHLESFRTRRLERVIMRGEPACRLQGTLERDGTPRRAAVEVTRHGRRVWMDDEPIRKLSTYASSFFALVFNPDSLYFFRHFPGERRQFFNRYLSFAEPGYVGALRAFRAIVAQKNKSLKQGMISALPEWNRLFAERGCGIMKSRREMVTQINHILPALHERLSGQAAGLRLNYLPSLQGTAAEVEETLQRAAEAEQKAGHALHGPHRDDFRLSVAEGRGDELFSQGEYRVAHLALKLAVSDLLERALAFRPVLILDDLLSELDAARRQRVMEHLAAVGNQVFLTATGDAAQFTEGDVTVRRIRAGRIE